jgi:ABC-2 type transport system ATP-binding protein
MTENAIEVKSLVKAFGGFSLRDVSFTVEKGTIVGLVGDNGTGKTTIIKCILGAYIPDSGSISIFDRTGEDIVPLKGRIGVVFDDVYFNQSKDVAKLDSEFKLLYPEWNSKVFKEYVRRFNIPEYKKVTTFSKGTKMKLQIAIALSHNSNLLIFDEATAGLDPMMRDEILGILLDFVKDEEHAVLISTHITSDLDRIADKVVFMHEGKAFLIASADELQNYGIIRCRQSELDKIDFSDIMGCLTMNGISNMLVKDRKGFEEAYPELVIDKASIEEIMRILLKRE